MYLPSHECVLSYSIFHEYYFWFFDFILTETSVEKNTPFYRPSDHFIVDQINNRCLLLVQLDMSHNTLTMSDIADKHTFPVYGIWY